MAIWSYILSSTLSLYLLGTLVVCVRADGSIMGTGSAGVLRYFDQFRRPLLRILPETLRSWSECVIAPLQQRFLRTIHGQLGIWDMAQLLAACSLLHAFRLFQRRRHIAGQQELKDSTASCHDGRPSHESAAGSHSTSEDPFVSGE